MPQNEIHGASSTNCIPAAGRNVHHSGTEIANSTRLAARATCFAQRSGTSRTAVAATTGQARSEVSTACEYMLAHHRAHHGEHADHEELRAERENDLGVPHRVRPAPYIADAEIIF